MVERQMPTPFDITITPDFMKNTATSPDGDEQEEYIDRAFDGLILKEKVFTAKRFYNCVFRNCDFTGAVFSCCKFSECRFESCNLSLVKVTGSDFGGGLFKDSKLVGVNWTGASWPRIKLTEPPRFAHCVLNDANFMGLPLSGIRMTDCLAKDADFREADLSDSDLSGTDFTASLFGGTDLTNADLTRAKNYAIRLADNKVKNAKFSMPEAMALLYCMNIKIV
jgi:uncharacterized protein YjbI with pentapeptide repeats